MSVLGTQDRPWRFSVRVDGVIRGHIVRRAGKWHLCRLDRDDVRGYEGVDVTLVIDEPHYLGMVMRQHMYDA